MKKYFHLFRNLYWLSIFLGLIAFIASRGKDGRPNEFILASCVLCGLYCILMPICFTTKITLHSLGHLLLFELAVLIGSNINSQLDEMAGMLPIIMAVVTFFIVFAGAISLALTRSIITYGSIRKLPFNAIDAKKENDANVNDDK